MAIWLILNASYKPSCLLNFKTKFVSFKMQLDDWATYPVCLDKPVTELTWYLLQALLFSRPRGEGVLTSMSSQS